MTIEHAADGTKTYTSPEGVVTKHADFSAVLHYQATGERLAYDVPGGAAPAGGPAGDPPLPAGGDPIAAYKERCRNVGRARAARLVGGK